MAPIQNPVLSDTELTALLRDDVPFGDLTTESLGIGQAHGQMAFRARHAMTVCAVEEAARLIALAGATARVLSPSGRALSPGEPLLEARGSAAALHRGWKAAQVLVEWASGIATATATIVTAAQGVPVACTRKQAPGTKALSVKAVRSGGATLHRLGLSESLLVFPQHRVFLLERPGATVARLHAAEPEKKVVVEVTDLEEARIWAQAGADVLQLERFSPEAVVACRQLLESSPRRPLLAVAGGVRADNAAAYVQAGVDFLVTSSPYLAPPRDVAVSMSPC
jgi:molybdenum transport protein